MDAAAGPMLRRMRRLGNMAGFMAGFMGGDGICSAELPKLSAGAIRDGRVICAQAGGVDASNRLRMGSFERPS